METYILKRTGQAPLRVRGEKIASAATSPDRASPRWSGATGRWEEVDIYRTASGKYVVALMRGTMWQGERNVYDATVHADLRGAVDWISAHCSARIVDQLLDQLPVDEIAEEVG